MQTTEINIPAAVIHMWKFLLDNIRRSDTTNLLIEPDAAGLGWVAVATDGHRLTKVTWPKKDSEERIDGDRLFISRHQLKSLASLSKKKDVVLVASEGSLVATAMFGVSVPVSLRDPCDVHFPDYNQVIPTTTKQTIEAEAIGVNPAYLIDALDHAKKFVVPQSGGISIDLPRWDGSTAPLVFTAQSKDLSITTTYVIMPTRI